MSSRRVTLAADRECLDVPQVQVAALIGESYEHVSGTGLA